MSKQQAAFPPPAPVLVDVDVEQQGRDIAQKLRDVWRERRDPFGILGELQVEVNEDNQTHPCLLYTSPSPRDS